ncbi:MAG TPA: GAF domain-containing sensor histidine kinase [Burkholderiales bacterium]|nr:GAF domain-containing sensor histidine kinase [Burkholderiales bacterium]
MEPTRTALPERLLDTLERLFRIPGGDLKATLTHVSNVIAEATGAEKVDSFIYDPARDSLSAVASSTQPLSILQRKLGLDVLPLSNGGRAVHVYQSGETFLHGHVDEDEGELRGIREGLGVRSLLGVPVDIGGKRRGMMMLASQSPEYFTADDARFVMAAGRWVGIVAHRAELLEEVGRAAAEQGRRAAADELVTVLAHDLRNYLAPLSLRIELLRHRALRAASAEDLQDIGAVGASLQRLSTFVDEMLDVARLDQGVFQMQPSVIDLGALLAEVVATFTTPQHPIELRVEEGEQVLIAADQVRLRQSIENIVANAVQKSPDAAAVSVFVTREQPMQGEPRARVEIVDEGPGIPAEVLPHIFERFYTGRGREGGLGMGLYLAKRIAVLHGGDLTVDSQPGKGARFTLTIPATESAAARPRARRASPRG